MLVSYGGRGVKESLNGKNFKFDLRATTLNGKSGFSLGRWWRRCTLNFCFILFYFFSARGLIVDTYRSFIYSYYIDLIKFSTTDAYKISYHT